MVRDGGNHESGQDMKDGRKDSQRTGGKRQTACKGKVIIIAIEVKIMRRSEQRHHWEREERPVTARRRLFFIYFFSCRTPRLVSVSSATSHRHTQAGMSSDRWMIRRRAE